MSSPLEDKLNEDLKASMKGGDKVALLAIRAVKTELMKRRTAKAGVEITDDLVTDTLRAYVKQLQGSIDELVAGGADASEDNIVQMRGEIAYLDRYLPKLLDDAATAALVDAVLAANGITDPKMAGKATGLVMKDHKGKVDPGVVARIVRQKLGA
ncbi:MAG: GatB/YqeY domain-containing protein [Deltaproteobacteria bacterium]|nr:GatB/YqeY domain-containing protein [Deltaproteobacteria bacterium]